MEPGPSDYMPERSLELLKNKKAQIDSKSSMFANAQPRLPEPQSITPAPGVYDNKNEMVKNIELKVNQPKKLQNSASQHIQKSLAGARFDGHQNSTEARHF